MNSESKSLDDLYAAVSLALDQHQPGNHEEELRRLVAHGHVDSMNLLAILLGDLDSAKHRREIVQLYEEAHEMGCLVAAENLAIQYRQWNEELLSRIWMKKAKELRS